MAFICGANIELNLCVCLCVFVCTQRNSEFKDHHATVEGFIYQQKQYQQMVQCSSRGTRPWQGCTAWIKFRIARPIVRRSIVFIERDPEIENYTFTLDCNRRINLLRGFRTNLYEAADLLPRGKSWIMVAVSGCACQEIQTHLAPLIQGGNWNKCFMCIRSTCFYLLSKIV